jgi:hypothetical protein
MRRTSSHEPATKIIDRLTKSNRGRRERSGRIPCGHSVDAGLRVLGEADEHRLGPRAHGSSLGRTDDEPRPQPLRRPRRRMGAFVVDQMELQEPTGLLGINTNMPATVRLTSTTLPKPATRRHPVSQTRTTRLWAAVENVQAHRVRRCVPHRATPATRRISRPRVSATLPAQREPPTHCAQPSSGDDVPR